MTRYPRVGRASVNRYPAVTLRTWSHVAEDAVRRFEYGYSYATVGRWLAKEARRRIKNERRVRKGRGDV